MKTKKQKKVNKTGSIQMRIRPDLKKEIREDAKNRKLSMSEAIEKAIEYWLIEAP